jgi:hypothetical protein
MDYMPALGYLQILFMGGHVEIPVVCAAINCYSTIRKHSKYFMSGDYVMKKQADERHRS